MEKELLPMNQQSSAADPAGSEADPAADAGAVDKTGAAGESGQKAAGQAEGKADPAGEEKKAEGAGKSGSIAEDVQKLVQEEMKKASMTPEEKAQYEAEAKEKSLKEREEAISLRERTADAKELLAENGLPAGFVEMVRGADRAETEKNVKAVKSLFDASVQAQVEKRMGGRTPDAGSGVSGDGGGDAMEDLIMSYL